MVGGGHAHVQVLRRFLMAPEPGVRLTVVLDRPEAAYSGMVPGLCAGDYGTGDLAIDVVPLARRAGAAVVLAPATRVDPVARLVELEGRPPLRYDAASLDVGSTVLGGDVPGVSEHALATRPIGRFVERVAGAAARRPPDGRPLRLVIVGGGAAGLELAFTLGARLAASGPAPEVCVLTDAPEILPGHGARVARAVRREAERRGIAVRCGVRVVEVTADAVRAAEDGEGVPCDLCVWATGAAPPALLGRSPLPLDARGFARVGPTLEVPGCDGLFAVGDCASLDADPWVPKAGVYPVRQGPVLDANLRSFLRGGRRAPYRPQRDFLMLLNLGERRALGAKWGWTASGRAVWKLKDAIDRRFVRRFQVLSEDGAPAPDFPPPMEGEPMPCGGCAAKVAVAPLTGALARLAPAPPDPSVLLGLEAPDDAAALALPGGEVLLATVDAFPAFCDDPWLVGRVAAVNAVSDVLATGGRARHALALVGVPESEPARAEETLYQVLSGVRAALDPEGVSLVGGHTTAGEVLFVGLAVTGEAPGAAALWSLGGARPGDALVLTKPLGTGVVLAADMRGLAPGAWVAAAHASMLRSNRAAARAAVASGARAVTDVSGFGLAGHLAALARASGVSALLRPADVPALPGALALLGRGLRSTVHEQNALARADVAGALAPGTPVLELLFDPQTSGGLLLAVPAGEATALVAALREGGDAAAAIGEVAAPRGDGAVLSLAQSS